LRTLSPTSSAMACCHACQRAMGGAGGGQRGPVGLGRPFPRSTQPIAIRKQKVSQLHGEARRVQAAERRACRTLRSSALRGLPHSRLRPGRLDRIVPGVSCACSIARAEPPPWAPCGCTRGARHRAPAGGGYCHGYCPHSAIPTYMYSCMYNIQCIVVFGL
jgi:hypothetical protein